MAIGRAITLLAMVFTSYAICACVSLRIDIAPSSYTESTPGFANISCSLDSKDYDVTSVLVIQIIRNGGQPLAFIQSSGISYDSSIDHPEKFHAYGLIKDAGQSYLKLSIVDPSEVDAGAYTCKIFYTDDNGYMKEHRASANFTVDKINVNEVVRQLVDQMTSMEKKLTMQTNTVAELNEKNENQSREMAEKVSVLENMVKDLTENNQNQSEMITQLSDKGCVVYVSIKANGVIVAGIEANNDDSYDQSSIGCVRDLERGDQVLAEGYLSTSNIDFGHRMTLMTGYLVRVY